MLEPLVLVGGVHVPSSTHFNDLNMLSTSDDERMKFVAAQPRIRAMPTGRRCARTLVRTEERAFCRQVARLERPLKQVIA